MRGLDTHPLGMAEPPEGAIVGEDVPRENEDGYDEAVIQEMVGILRSLGRPYIDMNKAEIRERAVDKLRKLEEE